MQAGVQFRKLQRNLIQINLLRKKNVMQNIYIWLLSLLYTDRIFHIFFKFTSLELRARCKFRIASLSFD